MININVLRMCSRYMMLQTTMLQTTMLETTMLRTMRCSKTMLQDHAKENKTNRHEIRLNDDTINYFRGLERVTALTFGLLMLIARAP
jgi:hypothetical protein